MPSVNIDITATGTLVAAVAGKILRLTSFYYELGGGTPGTFNFRSGASSDLAPTSSVDRGQSDQFGVFETAAGESIDGVITGGVSPTVKGHLSYQVVTPRADRAAEVIREGPSS